MDEKEVVKNGGNHLEKLSLGRSIPLTRIKGLNGSGFEYVGNGGLVRLSSFGMGLKSEIFEEVGEGPNYEVSKIYENKGRVSLEIMGPKGKKSYLSWNFEKSE